MHYVWPFQQYFVLNKLLKKHCDKMVYYFSNGNKTGEEKTLPKSAKLDALMSKRSVYPLQLRKNE